MVYVLVPGSGLLELQGRDVTTSTNPARGPAENRGRPLRVWGAAGDARPGIAGESPPQGIGHCGLPAGRQLGAAWRRAVAEVPNKFRRIRDRSDFPPPPKHGSGSPGPSFHSSRQAPHEAPRPRAVSRHCARRPAGVPRPAPWRKPPPIPDEAVDQITQMNRDAVTAYQAKKYEDARKILKQALDLASTAGPGQAPDQGAHAHPLRHRRSSSASSSAISASSSSRRRSRSRATSPSRSRW